MLQLAGVLLSVCGSGSAAAEGVFVRFQMVEPAGATYYVKTGGFIHKSPWYLPRGTWPEGADKDKGKRLAAGAWTPWLDVVAYAQGRLHGRLNRSGGVAEFPNFTADFIAEPAAEKRKVVLELATAAEETAVVKRFEEAFTGSLTSFLVSPTLTKDAAELESASQMTTRRLRWAQEASEGRAVSPNRLIIQTSFWARQRPELNLKEAEVLRLLGFNVVGNQAPEVQATGWFQTPGHSHGVKFGPAATQEEIEAVMAKLAERSKQPLAPGVPFGFSDEVVCRPRIGTTEQALKHFHRWLAREGIEPESLGVDRLDEVVPIEVPDQLRQRQQVNDAAARRVFYYTSRFRQQALTERLKWNTEALHKHFGQGVVGTTLVADHPYFAGTGMGMGMKPDFAWGNFALCGDWFQIGRERAVDLIGIEDWLGLQYMYGPNTTWEGFQLLGFQAAIFRSASRGELPIIAWITPSDETNLRLKSASALCQGAKHFFYWTYGPTCTSTENYWADLRSAYDGVVSMTRQLAAAEHIVAPGRPRKTRVAVLYSLASDLFQPFGYIHMLERRCTYLALTHNQYLVDFLNEDDLEAGRLADYDCLYVTDPCVRTSAAAKITDWVRAGGTLAGSCGAGKFNEFGEPADGLAQVFGVRPGAETQVQPGNYRIRGGLNDITYLDRLTGPGDTLTGGALDVGVLGTKTVLTPTTGQVVASFSAGGAAAVRNHYGRGETLLMGACPALAYAKEAKFVRTELAEKWPADLRAFLCAPARSAKVAPLVSLSHPVVEAGVYDADAGTALALANFTYHPIEQLRVTLPLPRRCRQARSVLLGPLPFTLETNGADQAQYPFKANVTVPLGLNDIVLFE